MNGTIIQTPAQAAGVECPKRTGEMPWDADCRKCRHYDACLAAVKRELGASSDAEH